MATNAGRFNNISVEAVSAVSQFEVVKMTSTGAAKAGAADIGIGVALNSVDPSATPATTTLSVQVDGIAMVKAGGTVTAGALVASDGSGLVVNAGNNEQAIGIALDGTLTVNEVIRVLVAPGSYHHTA